MLTCPVCQGEVPEVLGAPEQRCPHCRAVLLASGGVATPVSAEENEPLGPTEADAAGALRQGFGVWLQNLGAFTAFWLVPALVTAATTLIGYALGLGEITGDTGEDWRFYAVSIPLGFLDFVTSLFFVGGVAGMVAEAKDRGYASLAHGYRTLAQHGDRLFTMAVLVGGLMLLALALILLPAAYFTYGEPTTGVGILLLLFLIVADIPGFLILYWFLFAIPIAALHPEWPPGRAFRESRAFAQRNRTIGFTFALVLLLIGTAVVSYLLTRTLNLGLQFSGGTGLPGPMLEALTAFVAALLASVLPVLISVHYLGSVAVPAAPPSPAEAMVAAAEAPEPAPTRRRVRCPNCDTPILYESTGRPVLVTCPTCGRQGTLR
ncbi:MAG TPA: hypothetical protein VNZ52_13085 [Candidatus Thermoplasmatota archaeon]|nr:hypothetical protein [Candidatus Thermoplasmatota archaeon]